MLRISQIKRNAEKGEQGLKHDAAKELRIREEEIQNLRICKRSLDARKKPYCEDVKVTKLPEQKKSSMPQSRAAQFHSNIVRL